jgi:hypothetical protein
MCTFRIGVGASVPVRWRVLEGADEIVVVREGAVPTPDYLVLVAVMSDGSEVTVWQRWRAAVEVTLPQAAVAGQTAASIVYDGLAYTYPIKVTQ